MNIESITNYLKSNISFLCLLVSAILTAFFLSSIVINWEKNRLIYPVTSELYIKNRPTKEVDDFNLSDKYINNISDIMRYDLGVENLSKNTSLNNRFGSINTNQENKEEASNININEISVKAIIYGYHSLAIIKTNSPEDNILSEGDKIGQFTVKNILEDRVIFVDSKGKTFERQMLFGAELEPEESQEENSNTPSKKNEVNLSKREFASLFEPPDKLMKDLILSPYSKNNIPYGIRITTINPESLMSSKVGLLPGDVLLKINNKALTTPEEAMAAYSTIKNESEIVFKIDRNGKIFNLKLNLI